MTSPLSPALKAWGATFAPARAAAGQSYWKLVQADGPMDIGGQHHLFVDTWNEHGNRLVGVPVVFFSHDEEWLRHTEAKPGEPYAVDLPLFAGGPAYGVRIKGGALSDILFGVGLGHKTPHHSFRAIFQWSVAEGEAQPPPPPPDPGAPTALRDALDEAARWIDVARGLL